MSAIRETWPCPDCGHKHYASQDCPDHQWTDACPYEGLDCPTAEQRQATVDRLAVHGERVIADLLPDLRARRKDLARRARERAANCSSYPDTPEQIAERTAAVEALMPGQDEVIRSL